jgi:hypothetical protein
MKTGLEIQLKDPTYPTIVRECQLTGSSTGHLSSSNCKLMWHLKWTLPHQTTVGPELFFTLFVVVLVFTAMALYASQEVGQNVSP